MQHDGIKKEDGWFLQEVEIVNTKRKKSWIFMCNSWLSLHHSDGHSKREFFPHLGSKTGTRPYNFVHTFDGISDQGVNLIDFTMIEREILANY